MLKIIRSSFLRRNLKVNAFSGSSANLKIKINGKSEKIDFSALWLRFNCYCAECRQASSGQKTVEPLFWPEEIELEKATFEDNNLIYKIKGEQHEGIIPGDVLRKFVSDEKSRARNAKMNFHENNEDGWGSEIDFSKIIHEPGQYEMTQKIAKNGFVVVKNCPTMKRCVLDVVRKISDPVPFLYGLVQDIVNEPNPTNIAFSDAYLSPHMDFVYYESPPGLQFLLCRRNDEVVEGGESILIDAFEVAEHLKKHYPDEFETLSTVPVRFQKIHWERENPVHIEWEQPHIVLDTNKNISRVNWAPAFEGKSNNSSMTPAYLKAYRRFMRQVDESKTKTVQKLEIFNNRRMLHGRNAFKLNGGVRHMEVAYTNICEFRSRAQVLEYSQGQGKLITGVGNSNPI
ncbi:unnamed protein product [Oikopleura dioica]|uniref:TauD/TfdA-like domain-containing protein n=1 Tax=Oikopleura dioica TaxID=34765 RepID=E4XEI1_OIKDI|nr:unnamed protein product [Oikopleura dioica]